MLAKCSINRLFDECMNECTNELESRKIKLILCFASVDNLWN